MRNGQSPELAKGAIEASEAAPSLDVSIKKPLEKGSPSTEVAAPAEDHDFSSSSFAFEVERSADKGESARRIQTFAKPEQEQLRESRPLTNSTAKSARTSSTPTRATLGTKLGRRASGASLLDRYISFLAKMLKAIEKFILRKFNRGPVQTQHTQEAAENLESLQPDRPKKKKLPIGNGPGI